MSDTNNPTKLRQKFSFENSATRLDDGTWFQPLRQGLWRWILCEEAGYRISGYHYEALYEIRNQSFVHVTFQSYYPTSDDDWEVIDCNFVSGRRIGVDEAVAYIADWQFQIPDEYQYVLDACEAVTSEPVTPAARPLNLWDNRHLTNITRKFAHETRVIDQLKEIGEHGVRSVQEIRTWSALSSDAREHRASVFFAFKLGDRFRVDPAKWWGDQNIIPPTSVGILEMPWPEGIENLKNEILPGILKIVATPVALLHDMSEQDGKMYPTNEERRIAQESLMNSLPVLEKYVIELRNRHSKLVSGKLHSEVSSRASSSLKKPNELEMAAYLLNLLFKMKHREVAEHLSLVCNIGTVSKMIKCARQWYEAGNPVPRSIEEFRTYCGNSTTPVDPRVIDLGKNLEGRVVHQKTKKDH